MPALFLFAADTCLAIFPGPASKSFAICVSLFFLQWFATLHVLMVVTVPNQICAAVKVDIMEVNVKQVGKCTLALTMYTPKVNVRSLSFCSIYMLSCFPVPSSKSFVSFCLCFLLSAVCNPPCSNGGNCTKPNTCLCQSGYDGSGCNTGEPAHVLSHNVLICKNSASTLLMIFEGRTMGSLFFSRLLSAICNPPCSNGGSCTKPNTCSCQSGYYGRGCQTSELEHNACPKCRNPHTVKPTLSDHPTGQEKEVVIDRWTRFPEFRPIFRSFVERWTVSNVVERTRTIYATISHVDLVQAVASCDGSLANLRCGGCFKKECGLKARVFLPQVLVA